MIELYDHQKEVLKRLKCGSILWAGTGTGKSITALAYYFIMECNNMKNPMDLLIITTAQKRDKNEWDGECAKFDLSSDPKLCWWNVKVEIDSWNNIQKYSDVTNRFVIFDEQRVTGKGPWVNSFLKIAKNNRWILLTATPGDKWIEYMPVFIANGFYRNKTDFYRQHCIFSPFTTYMKIIGYRDKRILEQHRREILVGMHYDKKTVPHLEYINVPYNKKLYLNVLNERWDPYENHPIRNASGLCSILRRITNEEKERLNKVKDILRFHPKAIIFYNFDYELEMLRTIDGVKAEWNGHKHEDVPTGSRWAYFVQYNAGSEGWNCVTTDTVIFFSRSYSYKAMTQAMGRIDRINTAYHDLFYYYLVSDSAIDKAIGKALDEKQDFNETAFVASEELFAVA
ncbi:MAG: DEAD/DEAH box helicase family protein [Clostridiales bacterium]|nr:DEAD/DEAH box helicase family protein [Clostridiales bacterium]